MSNPKVAILRAREAVKRLPQGPSLMVELGTFIGVMAEQVLQLAPQAKLVAVDNWARPEVQPDSYRATGDFHARMSAPDQAQTEAQARARLSRYGDRAAIIKADSADTASGFLDGSVDLVFVDADHSREGVTRDIAAWWPKIRAGGWMGFHDYAHPEPRFRFGVTEAVDAFCVAEKLELERGDNLTAWVRKP